MLDERADETSYWGSILNFVQALAEKKAGGKDKLGAEYCAFRDLKNLDKFVPKSVSEVASNITEAQAMAIQRTYASMLLCGQTAVEPLHLDMSWYTDFEAYAQAVPPSLPAINSMMMCLVSVKEQWGDGIGAWRKHLWRSEGKGFDGSVYEQLERYVSTSSIIIR
jgi:hypothetical protein